MNSTHTLAMLEILPSWAQESLVDSKAVFITAAAGLLIVTLSTYRLQSTVQHDKSGIYELGGWSRFTAWPFFSRRYDFLHSNWEKTGQELFQFRVLQHTVVAVSGEAGRKVFHDDKHLDFTQGYQILLGGPENMTWFNKHVALLFNSRRLSDVIPSLLEDINANMSRTMPGSEGTIDPFKNVYDLVVQMTIRMVSCRAISNDPAAVAEMWTYFDTIEKGATPLALLVPWLPTPATRNKEKATTALFMFLSKYIEERRNSEPSSDAFDVLIAQGLDTQAIVGAGITNTSVNSCWILIYLAAHPEWKAKATAEIQAMLSRHAPSSKDPLHERLGAIPLKAWETELPALELCIQETLRLTATGAALRRNTYGDLPVAGKIVKRGWFMVHIRKQPLILLADIYTSPMDFDPDRYSPGREEDKKVPYAFIGWGGGRHPCSGMKFAKLEIKMIVALFLAGYEYELVDKAGKPPKSLPIPDENDLQRASPRGEPCFLKWKRLVN
ncbi:hypothetical protein HWV62_29186 [Athelia sp. TMB]|nr:hypothetical protein HWV62_29186 [Athelia sp. TMB]